MPMDFDKYVNKLLYANRGTNLAAWAEYKAEEARLLSLFTNDLFADLGIEANPKRDLLFLKAWQMGHYSGLRDVADIAGDLVELIL